MSTDDDAFESLQESITHLKACVAHLQSQVTVLKAVVASTQKNTYIGQMPAGEYLKKATVDHVRGQLARLSDEDPSLASALHKILKDAGEDL